MDHLTISAAHAPAASSIQPAIRNPQSAIPQPLPAVPVTVRAATAADVPFMDRLQKLHTKAVGWMPTKQLEAKVAVGQVLVAEGDRNVDGGSWMVDGKDAAASSSPSTIHHQPSTSSTPSPLGYCIASDRYFKRDDVGIVYQMNVVPGRQRGLIGATLLQAVFERAAYGCKLFCCWCAQDLVAANAFWAAMGFVPLAYRAGSEKKARVHIFWQRRVRKDDTTTPWWFPSQTSAGSIREDRLVLPIPPGTHWSDAKPLVLPPSDGDARPALDGPALHSAAGARRRAKTPAKPADAPQSPPSPAKRGPLAGGLSFAPPPPPPAAPELVVSPAATTTPAERKPKRKNDPKLVAAARELRDRWLERLNAAPALACGKYDVGRRPQIAGETEPARPLLPDARAA